MTDYSKKHDQLRTYRQIVGRGQPAERLDFSEEALTIDGLKGIATQQSKTILTQRQTIAHLKKQNDELRELSARKDRVGVEQVSLLCAQRDDLKAKEARIAELTKIGRVTAGYTFQLYVHLRNKGNEVLANEAYEIWQQAMRVLEGEVK
jgi:hypothetical protein